MKNDGTTYNYSGVLPKMQLAHFRQNFSNVRQDPGEVPTVPPRGAAKSFAQAGQHLPPQNWDRTIHKDVTIK